MAPVLGAGGAFVASGERDSRTQQSSPSRDRDAPQTAEALSEWVAAVQQHAPGRFDEHAARIASWTPARAQAFWDGLATRLREPDGSRLARRGALLHGDIARLGGGRGDTGAWAEVSARVVAPGSLAPGMVLSADGRPGSYGAVDGHWLVGRFLLALIRRDDSPDPMAAFWYRGAAAHLVANRALADLQLHLLEARRALPDDGWIMFYSGVLHEAFASPSVQGAMDSPQGPGRSRFDIGSPDQELREAESFLRRSLDLAPDLLEARLRLGRVLAQLGRHREAVTELGRVASGTDDTSLLYYARLFLGSAEEALGNADAARECYEGAAALYPGAQSARLAVAQLTRQSGDRRSAERAMLELLKLRDVSQSAAPDPWWRYTSAPGRHAGAFFKRAVQACEEAERR